MRGRRMRRIRRRGRKKDKGRRWRRRGNESQIPLSSLKFGTFKL